MKTKETKNTAQKSNFLQTWDKVKNDAFSWRGVAKTFKNVDDEIISKASNVIFSKFEKDFKVYAKEKANKKGFLSLYFGYLFLTKKAKEYSGDDENIFNFQKMIKKQEQEKKAKKQQEKENKK